MTVGNGWGGECPLEEPSRHEWKKTKNFILFGYIMAKMYRETVTSFAKNLTTPASAIYQISPIDADQIPNGYLKTVKISVQATQEGDSDNSFLVVASTAASAASTSDYITAGATPRGGGTVWLNLKRPVKSSAEEPNRPDGEVFIHILTQGTVPTPVEVNLVGEVWGRFLNMVAL